MPGPTRQSAAPHELNRQFRKSTCPGPTARRGMTFLEVILSLVLLALVTGMTMTAIGGVITSQLRQQQRLACAEVANRLMINYIDDQDAMPARGLPVVYGRHRFRWDVSERGVTLTPARPADPSAPNNRTSSLTADRLKTVQIQVWLSEESGGSYAPDPLVPHFTLSRIVDPIFGQLRNPDTADHIMKDPVLRQRFLDAVTAMASGVGSRPTGVTKPKPAGGATPQPSGSQQPRTGSNSRFGGPSIGSGKGSEKSGGKGGGKP